MLKQSNVGLLIVRRYIDRRRVKYLVKELEYFCYRGKKVFRKGGFSISSWKF